MAHAGRNGWNGEVGQIKSALAAMNVGEHELTRKKGVGLSLTIMPQHVETGDGSVHVGRETFRGSSSKILRKLARWKGQVGLAG